MRSIESATSCRFGVCFGKVIFSLLTTILASCGGENSTQVANNVQAAQLNEKFSVQKFSPVEYPRQTATLTAVQLVNLLSSPATNAVDNNFNTTTGTYDINNGKTILALASQGTGVLPCGVTSYHYEYRTMGGADEPISDSAALLVPTGTGARCSGARPIVLYAHGTETIKNYDMSNLSKPMDDRVLMVAAMFAANGYIVVAPNYAGYDTSTLHYHPYHNAAQQSQDMIDALKTSRFILASRLHGESSVTDNGKLFITGHSQGGFVAMATTRAMQAAGMTVTASAPSSGAYALAALGDMILYGYEDEAASTLMQLTLNGFHHSYRHNPVIGDIYSMTGRPSDIYSSNWLHITVDGHNHSIDDLFPGYGTDAAEMIAAGSYPLALFNSTAIDANDIPPGTPTTVAQALIALAPSITPPTNTGTGLDSLYAASFGPNPLLKNSFRATGLADAIANPDGAFPVQTNLAAATSPQSPLRKALKLNDLRGWTPSGTTQNLQMCGGHNDPEVFFSINTGLMYSIWHGDDVPAVAPYKDVDPYPNLASNSAAQNATVPNIISLAGSAAATALVVDVMHNGVTSPAKLATDIPAMINAFLPTAVQSNTDPFVQAFVAGIPDAVASSLNEATIETAIAQTLGGAPLSASNATNPSLDAAIGQLAAQGVLLAYHADLVAPSCHAVALQYFNSF